jgi:hypothetical protein
MTRLDGRAPAGQWVAGRVPQNDGPHVTLLGALGVHSLQAVRTVDGATDADVFRTSVKPVLGPTLPPGDMVVMDHWQAHKVVGVQQALARRGARLLYWPPLRARPVADRTLLVECQNGPACHPGTRAGRARHRPGGRDGDREPRRCLGLVQAVWQSLTVVCQLL